MSYKKTLKLIKPIHHCLSNSLFLLSDVFSWDNSIHSNFMGGVHIKDMYCKLENCIWSLLFLISFQAFFSLKFKDTFIKEIISFLWEAESEGTKISESLSINLGELYIRLSIRNS